MAKRKVKTTSYVIVAILVIIAIGILIIALNSSSKSSTTGQVVGGQNCREEQIPYEETEEYIETVPYTDRECESKYLTYKVERGNCVQRIDRFLSPDEPAKYSCIITNLDEEGGSFSMRIGFNIGEQQLEETQNKYIYSQSSETFSIERDAQIDTCYCYEQVPTKQVCRDVIKYKDVIKTRTVTKYRTETVCD